jgi:hypothetical protein
MSASNRFELTEEQIRDLTISDYIYWIEESMKAWNGERSECVLSITRVIKQIDDDDDIIIPALVDYFSTEKLHKIPSLINSSGNAKMGAISSPIIQEICDFDVIIFALIEQRSKNDYFTKFSQSLNNWVPFLGEESFNKYWNEKWSEPGILDISKLIDIVMSCGKDGQSWYETVKSLVDTAVSDSTTEDDSIPRVEYDHEKTAAFRQNRKFRNEVLQPRKAIKFKLKDILDSELEKVADDTRKKGGKTSGSTKTSKKDLSGGKKTKHRPTTMKQYCTWVQEWNLLLKDKVEYHQTFKVIAEKFNKSPKTIKNVIEDSQLKAKIEEFAMENNIDLKNK